VKGPAADAKDAPQPWGFLCNPVMKTTTMMMMTMIIFYPFPSNGTPVEWNWQGKTEVLGEKPVHHCPVPLCPPQIPHGLRRDRTRPSAVGGRRLTAWAMARPYKEVTLKTTPVIYRPSKLMHWWTRCITLSITRTWQVIWQFFLQEFLVLYCVSLLQVSKRLFFSNSLIKRKKKSWQIGRQSWRQEMSRHAVTQFFKVMRYKPKSRGFNSRWAHWHF
jgi:hypothetical protein